VGLFRLLLAFSVLSWHATVLDLDILSGDLAVKAFFIISGFYMSLVLSGKYKSRPRSVFYWNRVLRLYPAYLAVLAAQVIVLFFWNLHPFTSWEHLAFAYSEGGVVAVAHFLTNVFVFGQEVMFWLGMDLHNGVLFWDVPGGSMPSAFLLSMLPQAWALSVEFCFYLLAPFLVHRRNSELLLVFAASLVLRIAIVAVNPEYLDFTHRLFPAQLYLFVAGIFGFRLYGGIKGGKAAPAAGALLLAAVGMYVFAYGGLGGEWRDTVFLALTFVAVPFVFRLSGENRVDRFLGRVSYPFYLLHFLVATVYEQAASAYSPLVLVGLVFACSVAVLVAVEYPVDRVRRGRLFSSSRSGAYLPMQKDSNTAFSTSSGAMSPVISDRCAQAVSRRTDKRS